MNNNLPLSLDFIQPWSNILLKAKLPTNIIKSINQVYINILKNNKNKNNKINNKYYVDPKLINSELSQFISNGIETFFKNQLKQKLFNFKNDLELLNKDNVLIDFNEISFNTEKINEYKNQNIDYYNNVECIIFVKMPKEEISNSENNGKITFRGNNGYDTEFTNNYITINPEVGDMYIFSSKQPYTLWPFNSKNKNDLRITLSIKVSCILKSQYIYNREQEKEMYETIKKDVKSDIIKNIKNKKNNQNNQNNKKVLKKSKITKITNIKDIKNVNNKVVNNTKLK